MIGISNPCQAKKAGALLLAVVVTSPSLSVFILLKNTTHLFSAPLLRLGIQLLSSHEVGLGGSL